jgi:hypothetical protein
VAGELARHVGDGHQAAVFPDLVTPVGGGGFGVAVHLPAWRGVGEPGASDGGRDDQRGHAGGAGGVADTGEHDPHYGPLLIAHCGERARLYATRRQKCVQLRTLADNVNGSNQAP